jgi:hypothetical protein
MSEHDENWVDATAMGSSYEQQISITTGRWRHRPISMGAYKAEYPWKSGPALDLKGETK